MTDSPIPADPLRRSQLLVSVRSLGEARMAASAGVDVIDFKEPRFGPLAPVDARVWDAAARHLPDAVLSAALGESDTALDVASRVPATFRFAKVGPSGLRGGSEIDRLWRALPLRASVELVPVAYADHDAAACVDVEQVLDSVIASGRRRLLIDTFDKNGQSLTDHLPSERLVKLLRRARTAGVWIALAGSIRLDQFERLTQQGIIADCWGVRGDVCLTDADVIRRRTGHLDAGRLDRWMRALRGCDRTTDAKRLL